MWSDTASRNSIISLRCDSMPVRLQFILRPRPLQASVHQWLSTSSSQAEWVRDQSSSSKSDLQLYDGTFPASCINEHISGELKVKIILWDYMRSTVCPVSMLNRWVLQTSAHQWHFACPNDTKWSRYQSSGSKCRLQLRRGHFASVTSYVFR